MAEIISYPEKSILSENDYLLISDSQNSYITKKAKVSDINALAPANTGINGSGTANYIPKFVSTKVIGDSIIYNGTDTISIGAETNIAESRLNVYKTSDMTTAAPHVATFNEASSDHSASLWPGSGNNSADIYGSVSRSTFTGSGTLDQLMGANPVSRHSGSGTVQFVQGVQTTASLQGDGTAEFIYATYSKANINGTANTTVDAALGGWHVAELNGENNVDDIYGTISNVMLTKGTVNTSAVAHLLDFDQVPADTTVSNVYYIKAENDNLTATGEKFFIKEETGLPSQFSNRLILDSYGSGTYTGTATQRLAVDTNGNVIEIPIGSGPVDGSGTANYTARWIDTDTLGIGALYDDGTNIGIGTASPSEKLEVAGYAKASTGFKAGNYTILSESGNETSLSNSAYYPMFFKTNNSVRMTISNAGNIGIGTTSPGAKLTIKGSGLTSQDFFHIEDSGGVRMLEVTSDPAGNSSLQVKDTSGSTKNLINSSGNSYFNGGNIGIGTTSPAAKLHIDVTTEDNQPGFKVTKTSDLGENAMEIHHGTSSALRGVADFTNALGSVMFLRGDGNVGIGTTSPLGKLQVNEYTVGSQGNQNVHGEFSVFADSGNESLFLGVKNATYPNRGWAFNPVTNGVNSDLQIKEHGASGVRMTLQSAGNVGIGTTSPAFKTTIYSDSSTDSFPLVVGQPNAGNEFVGIGLSGFIAHNGAVKAGLVLDRKSTYGVGDIHILNNTTTDNSNATLADSKFTILQNGNVGIGTTSPSQKLEVAGNALINNSGDGRLYLGSTSDYVGNIGSDLYVYSSGQNIFYSGGSEQMRIKTNGNVLIPNGNVGIGTTSPSTKLEVITTANEDGIAIKDTSGNLKYKVRQFNGNSYSSFWNASNQEQVRISTSSTTYFNGGNVGIGTTSPAGTLHVVGPTGGQGSIYVSDIDNGAGAGDSLLITKSGTNAFIYNRDGGQLSFGSNNQSSNLTINSNGNVGIGTTSPVSTLDISKDTASLLNLHRPNSSAAAASFLDFSFNTANGTEAVYSRIRSDVDTSTDSAQSGDLSFYNASSGSIVERMRITSTGNVGIGTTSPENFGSGSHLLTVQSASGGGYGGFIAKTTNVTGQLWANQVGSNVFIGSRTNHPLIFTVNNVEKARINTSGNVGIGTTSPLGKLHITDSISAVLKVQETSGNTGTSAGVLFKTSPNTVDSYFKGGVLYEDTGDPNVIGKLHLVNRISADSSNANVGDAKLTIDTSGNVGIGTTSPQAKLDISTTGTGDSMIIRNDDASSSAAPVLMLLRDSASAANGDYLGQIKFKGNSDTGAERVYAKITAKISDATNGAEDSLIETAVRDNGSNLIVSRQTHQNLKLINGTGLESDGDIYMPVVGKGLIIKSPDGTRYRITVDNSGNLGTELA